MKDKLRVTIVQVPLKWQDVTGNIALFQRKLLPLKKGTTDLIVLPEMFSTGFSMEAKLFAEKEGGSAMQWMADSARQLNAVITGSIMLKEGKKYFNRLIWMRPDGTYGKYDKHHLFTMGSEGNHYTAGKQSEVFEVQGFRVLPLICYDLRFPVFSRNRLKTKGKKSEYRYDVLLYTANWPAVRQYPWQQLLPARAIENQSYVIGVNRIGADGNGIAYAGGSCVIDPFGQPLYSAGKKNTAQTVELLKTPLSELRTKFPVLYDADKFKLA